MKWEELYHILNMVCDSRHFVSCWGSSPQFPQAGGKSSPPSVKYLAVTQTSSLLLPGVFCHGSMGRGSGAEGANSAALLSSVLLSYSIARLLHAAVGVTTNDDVNSEGSKQAFITPNRSLFLLMSRRGSNPSSMSEETRITEAAATATHALNFWRSSICNHSLTFGKWLLHV